MSASDHRRQAEDSESNSSDNTESLLREDSEGWEDAEPDEEVLHVKDFFSDATFPNAKSMIEFCKKEHGFDFLKLQQSFALDFLGTIKLANYVRSEAHKGNLKPDISSKSVFEDDKYLQPALEDDALLFSIDELIDQGTVEQPNAENGTAGSTDERVNELEDQLNQLRLQFAEYRSVTEKALDDKWTGAEASNVDGQAAKREKVDKEYDQGYFDSYSYNEIHQTMLQDTVRTDAYRDFIYGNKHLFAGKTVLDVGCGTGILSMFCVKAGAAKVISVDNSAIIEKAKANIAVNGMNDRITCVRGKIEEITLPNGIEKVDIIVSEWMGYCLLFEAMFDSVIYARDRYLKPDGLMVPSHCTLHLAPVEDPEYIADNVTFWNDIYGFDMAAMMEKIYNDVIVSFPRKDSIAGRSQEHLPFRVLDLHTVTVAELEFKEPFIMELGKDVDEIDSWCIWFDTIFMPSRTSEVPKHLLQGVADSKAEKDSYVLFTTGPFGKETHWRSGICMIDRSKRSGTELKQGQILKGSIIYSKDKEERRGLNIAMTWEADGSREKGDQNWELH